MKNDESEIKISLPGRVMPMTCTKEEKATFKCLNPGCNHVDNRDVIVCPECGYKNKWLHVVSKKYLACGIFLSLIIFLFSTGYIIFVPWHGYNAFYIYCYIAAFMVMDVFLFALTYESFSRSIVINRQLEPSLKICNVPAFIVGLLTIILSMIFWCFYILLENIEIHDLIILYILAGGLYILGIAILKKFVKIERSNASRHTLKQRFRSWKQSRINSRILERDAKISILKDENANFKKFLNVINENLHDVIRHLESNFVSKENKMDLKVMDYRFIQRDRSNDKARITIENKYESKNDLKKLDKDNIVIFLNDKDRDQEKYIKDMKRLRSEIYKMIENEE